MILNHLVGIIVIFGVFVLLGLVVARTIGDL
jgi:hypothetical protein